MPTPTDDGKTYTFKIRQGVKFHDGSPLTAADVAASWNRISSRPRASSAPARQLQATHRKIEDSRSGDGRFPPEIRDHGISAGARRSIQLHLQEGNPRQGPALVRKEHHGSGPFKFVNYDAGQSIKGERNPDYYHKGLPYLDGIVGIFAPKQATRVEAIRGDRAAIEFRGLPPSARDELQKELGDKITVQKSDWNCGSDLFPNHKQKPFDDVRVRRALTLAIDRWGGAPALAKIAMSKRRRHRLPRLPARREEGGTATDRRVLARHRKIARRGETAAQRRPVPRGCSFELLNRNVDQPYKYLGIWLVDRVEQDRTEGRRRGDADRAVVRRDAQRQFPCRPSSQSASASSTRCSMSEPILPRSVTENYGNYDDPKRSTSTKDAARDRPPSSGADARVREIGARHEAHESWLSGGTGSSAPLLRQGLEDRPEPFPQSGPGDGLARQIARMTIGALTRHRPGSEAGLQRQGR